MRFYGWQRDGNVHAGLTGTLVGNARCSESNIAGCCGSVLPRDVRGTGMTNELSAAHRVERLTVIELTLGDTDHHLARFGAQPGFKQAA